MSLTTATVAALIATTAFLAACAPAIAPTPPTAASPLPACEDPVYLELRASDPDTLTEREWTRLQQLEELCLLERRAADTRQPAVEDTGHRGLHGAMWLWMPAMMVFGGLMWLMMGT